MSNVRWAIADHVATLTIDNPANCNALERDDIADLRAAIDVAVRPSSDVRALVLTGAGKVFCSGINLCRMAPWGSGMTEQEGEIKRMHLAQLVLRLADVRLPTIAAVNGPAVGAGMSLVVACTMAVMDQTAYFEPSFVRLGLVPDAGLTYYLPRRVGAARAARILLTGERIDAKAALDIGLATHIANGESALDLALALAGKIASFPNESTALTYRLLRETFDRSLTAQLQEEGKAQTVAMATADCGEGIRAFFEKRLPVFNRVVR